MDLFAIKPIVQNIIMEAWRDERGLLQRIQLLETAATSKTFRDATQDARMEMKRKPTYAIWSTFGLLGWRHLPMSARIYINVRATSFDDASLLTPRSSSSFCDSVAGPSMWKTYVADAAHLDLRRLHDVVSGYPADLYDFFFDVELEEEGVSVDVRWPKTDVLMFALKSRETSVDLFRRLLQSSDIWYLTLCLTTPWDETPGWDFHLWHMSVDGACGQCEMNVRRPVPPPACASTLLTRARGAGRGHGDAGAVSRGAQFPLGPSVSNDDGQLPER